MNVEIETETLIFLFWDYLFRNFGILSLQFTSKLRYAFAKFLLLRASPPPFKVARTL
jgi:hypothetical protein